MKKVLSIVLALAIVLSLGVVALAVDDMSSATFTVNFTDTNDGAHPAETFTFSDFTFESVSDAGVDGEGNVVTTGPSITKIADVTIAAGNSSGTATINLPKFPAVGVYTYTFNQIVGTTSGVTYYKNDSVQTMKLVVTVVQDGTQKRIAAVHVEPKDPLDNSDKTGQIANTYESGKLTVNKTVAGLLGDQSKYFDIKVTFTPIDGETIKSAITYKGGQYASDTALEGNSVTLQLKHDDTITFSNVPATVTYTVQELEGTDVLAANAKTSDGYTVTYSNDSGTIAAGATSAAVVTNTKDSTPDTGITLDSLPYVLMAVMAMFAAVVIILNKRRASDY